ncbi:MAG: NAD(P)-dependent oxidoreductase [Clostridia bacterium]|nr:NAD(P)-dependent oxidoreductase [Clostridia bacterium]
MEWVAFGGDARMEGALAAARRAGHTTRHVQGENDMEGDVRADVVLLPWPRSFREDRLVGGRLSKEEVLRRIPACRMALIGGDVDPRELPQAERWVNPQKDEAFLRVNALLTAEGALFAAMNRRKRAFLHSTCVVTGFGRIAQALARRLCAMDAFVIVCARNEAQMRAAHQIGAHPVPLAQIASACAQADMVFNTVPARVLGDEALAAMKERGALMLELASAPYGADIERAAQMGVEIAVESGIPGRYAPMEAGAALCEALLRAMSHAAERKEGEEQGGRTDG